MTFAPRQLRRLRRSRARSRGAAMVEGIIVISTFLVFMGLIVWSRKAYGMKLDEQMGTRSSVMYFASHGCEGGVPGPGVSLGSNSAPTDSREAAESGAGKASVPNKKAADRQWNSASSVSDKTASWQTVWDVNARGQNASIQYGKQSLVSKIHAESHVTCNEKKYDNQWTAWFQFGLDFVKRGFGGVGDLFR